MSNDKLNNLLSIEEYSDKKFLKNAKQTKRTEVAKDILESAEVTGKIVNEKPESSQDAVLNKLHNIVSLDEFSDSDVIKPNKSTKRTENSKDVLHEKKKEKVEEDDDDCDCKKKKYDDDDDDDDDKDKARNGLTAAQKKLPKALQDAILKKQNKK